MSDSRDLLTLEEAKSGLNVWSNDQVALLEQYITAASRLMDQQFGNTVALSVTSELHSGTSRSGRGYRDVIVLDHRPVRSISSMVEHRNGSPITLTAETTTQQPADSYLADIYDPDPSLYNGFVRRRQSGQDAYFEHGRNNISVTYQAGRVASTTAVDPRFKRGCLIVLENLWRDREPGVEELGEFAVPRQSFPGFAVPRAVTQLLSEEAGQHEPYGIA